jgi:transcriptional regulator with XRE-family HTH domain
MKNINPFRKELGITQEKLAMLLGVSRSSLALYELGKRSLPVDAKVKLAELLKQAQQIQTLKTNESNAIQEQEKKKIVENLIQNNQIKQYSVNKKTEMLGKKQEKNEIAQELIQFINQDAENFIDAKHKIIKQKPQEIWQNVIELQLKKELLQEEEKILKNIFKKLYKR